MTRRLFAILSLMAAVVILSAVMSGIWGTTPEKVSVVSGIDYSVDMTVREFANRNGLPEQLVAQIFSVRSDEGLNQTIGSFGYSEKEALKQVNRALALSQEYRSKNWSKIPLKFALWALFLAFVFLLFRYKHVTAKTRFPLYITAIAVFGILLGADPSPMGTVKDAIVLYGTSGAVFPPRMIALGIFILFTVAANKFICSWGCQFGTLQDLLFRINRDSKDVRGFIAQYKMPFFVSNSVRIAFFFAFSAAAVLFVVDIVEVIDPFKVFNPMMIGIAGGAFLLAIIGASFFVYRPWCHLFCPFGLVSWLFEKISLNKITVDYDTCIACEKCARACPTHVMNAILKRESVIPDCFSCGTCINACPTGSISIRSGKRARPPINKFLESRPE
ncbi:MAG: 4Fe-4S binding protein [Spirochaetes bacterium]|nr:4Fe-4S binding protein [Spirochaetota bacterium]